MSKGIEAFKKRYSQLGRICISVDELEGLEIWAKPFTLMDQQELEAAGHTLDSPDGVVFLILRKAEDADGAKLFAPEDAPVLKRVGETSMLKAIAVRMITSEGDVSPEEK